MAEFTNLLSQEELEALSAGIQDGSIEADTGVNLGLTAVTHDLTNEDSSLGVNVSAIDMINERFVRQFRVGLLDVLRTAMKINAKEVEIMKFGEYLKDLRAPLSVNTIRLNPLRGYSVAIIEPSIIFAALDNFFGGFGRGYDGVPPNRMFTPTETSIIKIMLNVLFCSLQEAWGPILQIKCEHIGAEINPQFAQIADENDLVVVSRFVADIGKGAQGNIDLVYPYNALKPIRDLLRSRVQTGDGDDVSDKEWSADLRSAAEDAELQVSVKLAEIETTLVKFEALKEGDVVYFSKAQYARMYVNGVPVFDADVGASGSQMAARLVQPLSPIK